MNEYKVLSSNNYEYTINLPKILSVANCRTKEFALIDFPDCVYLVRWHNKESQNISKSYSNINRKA